MAIGEAMPEAPVVRACRPLDAGVLILRCRRVWRAWIDGGLTAVGGHADGREALQGGRPPEIAGSSHGCRSSRASSESRGLANNVQDSGVWGKKVDV